MFYVCISQRERRRIQYRRLWILYRYNRTLHFCLFIGRCCYYHMRLFCSDAHWFVRFVRFVQQFTICWCSNAQYDVWWNFRFHISDFKFEMSNTQMTAQQMIPPIVQLQRRICNGNRWYFQAEIPLHLNGPIRISLLFCSNLVVNWSQDSLFNVWPIDRATNFKTSSIWILRVLEHERA